jgi:hypothetical protein
MTLTVSGKRAKYTHAEFSKVLKVLKVLKDANICIHNKDFYITYLTQCPAQDFHYKHISVKKYIVISRRKIDGCHSTLPSLEMKIGCIPVL